MKSFIKKYWKGEAKLWKVFWIWNVLGVSVVSFATEVLFIITVFPVFLMIVINKNFDNISFSRLSFAFLGVFTIIFAISYSIWALVSLWRSAFNGSRMIYGYLARAWVILVVFFSIVAPVMGIIYPNSVFDDFLDEDDIIFGPREVGRPLPSESEWSKIVQGLDKEIVEKLLGPPPQKIDDGDGTSIWSYWHCKVNEDEVPLLLLVPWGKVYKVYFDASEKVISKEVKLITKEEVLNIKDKIGNES